MTRKVAAFDFDGTILDGDAVLPFCMRAGGRWRTFRTVVRNAPKLLAVALGKGSRDKAKGAMIHGCFAGLDETHLNQVGTQFADHVVETRLFESAHKRLQWHQSQGHETVIVSASLDTYLRPVAQRLGIDTVLSTRLEFSDGVATGSLDGPNIRSEQKRLILQDHLAGDDVELWAYGNSADDEAMLAIAQHPVRVDKSGTLTG